MPFWRRSMHEVFFTISPKKINLSLNKTVNKPIVKIGNEIIFTLTLKNEGPQPATGVEVKDLLPAGLTYVAGNSTIPINTSYNATTGILDLSALTINNGQTVVLKIAAILNTINLKLNTTEVFKTEQIDINSTPDNSN